MIHIDPTPRPTPLDHDRFVWPVEKSVVCDPVIAPSSNATFAAAVEERRSARRLDAAPVGDIVNALAFATRPRFTKIDDPLARMRSPVISAGALHPISSLLVARSGENPLMRYDAPAHRLDYLAHDEACMRRWLAVAADVLPDAGASWLVLIAEAERTEALYENSASLLWRDAGAFLQMVALSCSAYELGFCAMGVVGREIWEALGADPRLIPVGAGAIGRRRD